MFIRILIRCSFRPFWFWRSWNLLNLVLIRFTITSFNMFLNNLYEKNSLYRIIYRIFWIGLIILLDVVLLTCWFDRNDKIRCIRYHHICHLNIFIIFDVNNIYNITWSSVFPVTSIEFTSRTSSSIAKSPVMAANPLLTSLDIKIDWTFSTSSPFNRTLTPSRI